MPNAFQPPTPRFMEYGRLQTHSALLSPWPCRQCDQPLAHIAATTIVICMHCDTGHPIKESA